MKRVPTQDCLRKSFNTHLRKMLTRRLRPKQNSLRDFSTVPFLYKPNHLQKKRGSDQILLAANRFPCSMDHRWIHSNLWEVEAFFVGEELSYRSDSQTPP